MFWSGTPLFAQQIDHQDAQEIHAVVRAQLQAFAEDNAEKAFELATADTQSIVGNPENLLKIVKNLYPPVYRHRLAIFSEPELINGEPYQTVGLTDGDNQVWLVVYKLKRESDGSWRIDDCLLFETDSVST